MTKSRAAHPPAAHLDSPRRDPVTVLAASTFSAGLLLLPRELQHDARRLYQVLRTLDDLVDEHHPAADERVTAVEHWATGHAPRTPETLTLADLADSYPLCRGAFRDFCQGMRHDIERASIETEQDLDTYCHQVGGTVGIMLCALLGNSQPECVKRMEQLGRAMQLTNILRDIDEDHENGCSYIPRSLIERFGLPRPGHREELMRDQIPRADKLYEEGMIAIPLLRRGRRAMKLSSLLYQEILRQIEREGFGQRFGRAQVPGWRKQQLIAQTMRLNSTNIRVTHST